LNAKTKTAKRDLVRKTIAKGAAWTGAITFGMYSGIVPNELIAAAKALGLIQIVAEIGEQLLDAGNVPQEVKSNDFYFLWKVMRKKAKR
jgi:hypothetical protein